MIEGFTRKSGTSGDLITVTGSNFSPSKTKVEVFVGADKCILVSTDADVIKFTLPEYLSKAHSVPLIVKSVGTTLDAADHFLLNNCKSVTTSIDATGYMLGRGTVYSFRGHIRRNK
jgi:hypothetical protein